MGHCQTNLNGPAKSPGLRRSGRQLTPLSERGSAVLLENVAGVAVAVVVEVVVDRGVGGCKFQRSPATPPLRRARLRRRKRPDAENGDRALAFNLHLAQRLAMKGRL